jgi:hypothetical protein
MIRGRNRQRIFTAAAVIFAFVLINLVIAATRLDRVKEDRFYSDIYSILNDVLPDATIPFANTHGKDERVNNLGFRGTETTWEKPAGVKRLVSVGDSSTFGVMVGREETYTALVGARLAELGPWETLNCGIPGTNILQQRLLYELKLKRLGADFVMVYVVPNVRADLDAMREVYDRFGRESAGPLRKAQKALGRLPLYRLLLRAIRGPVSTRIKSQVEMIYTEHRDDEHEKFLLRGYEKDLEEMRERIVAGGARPIWIWHINRITVLRHADRNTPREAMENDPISFEGKPYFAVLRDFAKTRGDPVVNPYPLAVEAAQKGETVFLDVIHPTAAGHSVIALAVWEVLAPMVAAQKSALPPAGTQ